MATVKYIKCDICDRHIQKDPKKTSFLYGFRFFVGSLLNYDKLDICEDCLKKMPKIKENIRLRDKVTDEVVSYAFKKYNDADSQAIYLEGVEDVLGCFDRNILCKSK